MSTKQKIIILIIILPFTYMLAIQYSQIPVTRMLTLLSLALYACVVGIAVYIIWEIGQDDSYDVKASLVKVLTPKNDELVKSVSRIINNIISIIVGRSTSDSVSEEDILRVSVTIAILFSTLLGLTLVISLLQDFVVANETDVAVIDRAELPVITVTSSLESNTYIMTATPSNIKPLMLTPTPISTSTFTPTSTSTSTSTPTITTTPTRRVIFGQSLSSTEHAVTVTSTPTITPSEREKGDLPSIVVLGFTKSEDDVQPKLLLANFGYTLSMANWKLYIDRKLVCTFGEYIFWPDTVLALDVTTNLEQKTVDDQLILRCEQLEEDIFSGPVVIKLQDHLGVEVDRYTYEEAQ